MLILILAGVLYFGLIPKGFDFKNRVLWLKNRSGLHFSPYGIAYTQLPFGKMREIMAAVTDFSIEIAIRPEESQKDGFRFILSIFDGKARDQLLVGQWRSYLIVMNGDDYDHTRNLPRISFDIAGYRNNTVFLTITSGKDGTQIYLNGQLSKTRANLQLQYPSGPKSRLVLANSVFGHNSWVGNVYSLAIYGSALSEGDIAAHYSDWLADSRFIYEPQQMPVSLYRFDENQGYQVDDHGLAGNLLLIPKRRVSLKKQFLSPPWHKFRLNQSLLSDVFINLLGFIPLGAVLVIVLSNTGRLSSRWVLVMTVAIGFILSLMIEGIQAWMPSRSSNLHDLIFNTIGGLLGAKVGAIIVDFEV